MKSLLLIIFLYVSVIAISQNISDLEKQKTSENASKELLEQQLINNEKHYDSIFANIEFEKKNLESVKSQLTISLDSLNKLIAPFGVNESNLGVYQLLINEKIIDPNSKKYSTYSKKLRKEFAFSEDQKFLIIAEFICLEKFDNKGKVSSFEKIKLSVDQIEKQNKLLSKNAISFLTENKLILENLTGVNSRYLILFGQLNGINDQLKTLNSEIKINSDRKENIFLDFTQKKNNIENQINSLTKSINEIDFQITQIKEQIAAEAAKTLNYSKFKTKKINGVEVYPAPLSVREFRNGDEIKKARTPGEWIKFNELEIPAYHFKDFDDNQANYGFIYNYHAITDDRELAPYGFHKLNLIDFNHLENQLLFTDTKLVDCYCGDGTQSFPELCTNCYYWTSDQRKNNYCTYCKNWGFYKVTKEKCSRCNGTKKVKALSMRNRKFCIFPSSSNKVGYGEYYKNHYLFFNYLGKLNVYDGKCNLKSYKTEDIYSSEDTEDIYSDGKIGLKEQGYQVLICKDQHVVYSDDFASTKIGDIEIMNTYLNVTKFRNGDPIKYIEDPVEWELALRNKIPAYCYFNNVNDGKGCIYNVHAWNDKRGLMPLGWRSITRHDKRHLYFILERNDFTLDSEISPISPPKGVINKYGIFVSDYFNHLNFTLSKDYTLSAQWIDGTIENRHYYESGYVLCVRDGVQTRNSASSSNTNQNNTPTNPFSGSSGTSDSGGGFGSDSGQGSGLSNPVSGSNGERVIQNNLSSNPKTPNAIVCQIAMKLIIDSNGNVVAVSEIRDKTTTTNQALIDELKALVKKEVKYDQRPGADNATVYYTVTVIPN